MADLGAIGDLSNTATYSSGYTISGTVKDDTNTACRRVLCCMKRFSEVTGVVTQEFIRVSNAETGYYAFSLPDTALRMIIALDDTEGTNYNALILDKITPA
jgi:hypothetical protein